MQMVRIVPKEKRICLGKCIKQIEQIQIMDLKNVV